jgi:hypothetical protein
MQRSVDPDEHLIQVPYVVPVVVGTYGAAAPLAINLAIPRNACPEQKIDVAIALIMAIGRCMVSKPAVSVYETLGDMFVQRCR